MPTRSRARNRRGAAPAIVEKEVVLTYVAVDRADDIRRSVMQKDVIEQRYGWASEQRQSRPRRGPAVFRHEILNHRSGGRLAHDHAGALIAVDVAASHQDV